MDRGKRRHKPTYRKKTAKQVRRTMREIPLTQTDRITYIYTRDSATDAVREVINVSYDIWIERRWHTILRYDSTHGYLHQHMRLALTVEKEFISKEHILRTHSHGDWLTFAIEDIKTNFLAYRHAFLQRSNVAEKEKG